MYTPWLTYSDWEKKDAHLSAYFTSVYQRPSLEFDSTGGIHTLLGPRRIGKSTQFKLWIRELLDYKNAEKVAYIDAERIDNWKELLPILEECHADFLFIDEITAVKEWPRALKVLVDSGHFAEKCIWITGSNAFDLKNLGERLPGRRGRGHKYRDLQLLPLNFSEFASVVEGGQQGFELFALWGGYPMAISELKSGLEVPSYDLMQELLDVTLGEASRRHRSPRLTAAVAERLWHQLGSRSSYNSLAKILDAGSHPIVAQYIEILCGCYNVIEVDKYNPKTHKGFLRKEKKFYFWDPLAMAAIVSWSEKGTVDPEWGRSNWEDPSRQGGWLESLVASELKKQGMDIFYRDLNGGELDFFAPHAHNLSIECKRTRPTRSEVAHLEKSGGVEYWFLIGEESSSGHLIYNRLKSI